MNPRRLLVLIVTLLLLNSCGTTHHFIPAHPLQHHESQINITWKYDLNGNLPKMMYLFPQLDFYLGTGEETVMGFGCESFFAISHASFAKYWVSNENNYNAMYVSANRIMAATQNSLLEVGYMRSSLKSGNWHSFQIGAGIGNRPAWGSVPLWLIEPTYKGILFPILKYNLTGSDFGVSTIYQHNLTKSMIEINLPGITHQLDTIITINSNEIDSIGWKPLGPYYGLPHIYFIARTKGDTLWFQDRVGWGGCIPDISSISPFYITSREFKLLDHDSAIIVLNFEELVENWKSDSTISLLRYPTEVRNKISGFKPWNDVSIGISIQTHKKH